MNEKDFKIIKDLCDEKANSAAAASDEQLAAEGRVRLSTGEIIKRADAVIGLRDVGTAAGGVQVLATVDDRYYWRDKSGSLRRSTPKPPSKKERRRALRS